MSIHLDPPAVEKLAKICAMFSSDFPGERAAAAALADKLIRDRGLQWDQVLTAPAPKPSGDAELIEFALKHGDEILNAWEHGFLTSIKSRWSLTKKQRAKLESIVEKVQSRGTGR